MKLINHKSKGSNYKAEYYMKKLIFKTKSKTMIVPSKDVKLKTSLKC